MWIFVGLAASLLFIVADLIFIIPRAMVDPLAPTVLLGGLLALTAMGVFVELLRSLRRWAVLRFQAEVWSRTFGDKRNS